jgi:enediyne biosynthesis protein E4
MGFRSIGVAASLLLAVVALGAQTSVPAGSGAFPKFENITEKAGIDFQLESGDAKRWFILESNSAGVVVIDYDNDGWPDLYFINGSTIERLEAHEKSRGNRLYHNNRNGTFTDVTDRAGVRGNGDWGMGGCIGDVDNNGYDDIFVTNYGRDVLYLNNGNGTFRDVSKEAGIEGGNKWHSGCAFGDYDGDGDLDLYVSNYAQFDIAEAREMPLYKYAAQSGQPINQPGPNVYKVTPHEFYENVGHGHFIDASEKSGVGRGGTSRLGSPSPYTGGYGFGVVWGDYDNDGDLDVYVANDTSPNFLFRNNGDKTFTEVGVQAGAAFDVNGRAQAGMGVDMADYDNDGNLDIFVTNFADDHFTLYHNEGDGTFTDVSRRVGLMDTFFLGWGTQFVDLDHDGLLDLVTVNSHVQPSFENTPRKLRQAGYRQRPLIFHHEVTGTLREIGVSVGGAFTQTYNSRGLAVADLNNDGQMDLVFQNQEERPAVLINQGVPGNWITIKLRGTKTNRSAIGARITLRAGDRTQMREVKSGGSFLSQSDLRQHFGLGDAKSIDALTIRWPSGRLQVEKPPRPNQFVVVTEK